MSEALKAGALLSNITTTQERKKGSSKPKKTIHSKSKYNISMIAAGKLAKASKLDLGSVETTENVCLEDKAKEATDTFINSIVNFFKTDEEKEKPEFAMNSEVKIYADTKPNSKGHHIYDIKKSLDVSGLPYSNSDNVNHFLKNTLGFIQNQKLKDNNPKKQDPNIYFSAYIDEHKILPIPSIKKGGKTPCKRKTPYKHNKQNKTKKNKKEQKEH